MSLAHPGQPPEPHDLWAAWNADPLVMTGLVLLAWAYWSGRARLPRRAGDRWRGWCFGAALLALGVALLSPLDALSDALASAHMAQHLLLLAVAAPLLALSAPWSTLLHGTPATARRAASRWRGRLGLTPRHVRALHRPVAVFLAYVGTVWFWHAAGPYGTALRHEAVHVLEHACFLLAGVLFWQLIAETGRSVRASPGLGILLLFGAAMQGVFLSALLTFATEPWYGGYASTTHPWGLDPLADQQLAGVLMWIPGGAAHLAAALTLLVGWIQRYEHDEVRWPAHAPEPPRPSRR